MTPNLTPADFLSNVCKTSLAISTMYRVEADWPGGGFGYTKPFADAQEATRWAEEKAKAHTDAAITVEPRAPAQRGSHRIAEGCVIGLRQRSGFGPSDTVTPTCTCGWKGKAVGEWCGDMSANLAAQEKAHLSGSAS